MSLLCTRMSSVCHLMYSYVIRMSHVYTRSHPYVTCLWFYYEPAENKYRKVWKYAQNVLYNIFIFTYILICYNMNFILPCLQTKLYKKTHNTAQNCTKMCATCCTIRFFEKVIFLCVLVSLCFSFVKQVKDKNFILNLVFKLLVEIFPPNW